MKKGVVRFTLLAGMLSSLLFATCGTLTKTGGGSAGYIFSYAVYEHGWPFVFRNRVCNDPPPWYSRIAFFVGEDPWDWWPLLADLLTALLLVAALGLMIATGRRYSLRTMLVGILILAIPLALLARRKLVCDIEDAALTRLENIGVFIVIPEYVGPRWLARVTGTVHPFGLDLQGVTFVRVDKPPADISCLVECLSHLRFLKKVALWDDSEVSAGPDFRLRLNDAIAKMDVHLTNTADPGEGDGNGADADSTGPGDGRDESR